MTRTNIKTKSTGRKNAETATKSVAERVPKSPRRPRVRRLPDAVAPIAAPARPVTKREQLASMLLRDEGATLNQMIAALDWLPHTTRAALTGLKKLGYAIDSDKIDGVRTYRAVAPQ